MTRPFANAALGFVVVVFLGGCNFFYVPDEAAKHREKGESFLTKRLHVSDPTEKAELLTQAIEEFKQAIAIKPDFDVAFNLLGHCYIERGQWDAALKYLDRALQIRKDYPAALYNRGQVFQHLSAGSKDPSLIDRAIADYETAIDSKLSSGFVGDIRKALAEAYHQKGDLNKAIEQLKLYLSASPHAPDAALMARKIRGLELMLQGSSPPSF
jgi:tetratricopeptide (TPR) repeat protein